MFYVGGSRCDRHRGLDMSVDRPAFLICSCTPTPPVSQKPVAAGGSSTVGPDTNATEKPNVPTILMDEVSVCMSVVAWTARAPHHPQMAMFCQIDPVDWCMKSPANRLFNQPSPHTTPYHPPTQKFSGIFNTASGGKAAGESLLGAAAALSAASNSGNAEGTCRVANEAELRTAVTVCGPHRWCTTGSAPGLARAHPIAHTTNIQELSCPVVILTSTARDAYVLEEEIVVRRSVVIMGNSITLPFIDCAEAVRGFRVVVRGVRLLVWII